MIPLKKAPLPDDLAEWLGKQQERLNDLIAGAQPIPENLMSAYRDPEVKKIIKRETREKCAYCESKILHVDHGDVEHKLPKSRFPNLRLTWSNLTFVCGICNEHKSDYFNATLPLLDPYTDTPLRLPGGAWANDFLGPQSEERTNNSKTTSVEQA